MNPLASRAAGIRPHLGAIAVALIALIALIAARGACAQNVPAGPALVSGTATIATGAANGTTGAITINETAGLDNAQGNQLALATGAPGVGYVGARQAASTSARVGDTASRIEGSAFSNISGALMVNQSAGAGNLQRNSTMLGTLGAEVRAVSDTELSETAPGHGGMGLPVGGRGMPEASISGDAFKHISGIVQVNQTSGAGNATANSFVLRPPAGTLVN
ncbi:hypothetical protein [Burkholderia ubonensis]|uniref:hypothetical protein n=1 Tax=Burkholderia ubonensis TaxID=101571 RepID=UPI000756C13D|nr:hypothetical protein [Burkholderia ubonensis]KWC13740.1 hypothetical protein WL46_02700 [Burkholderia ubonensis]